MYRSTAILATLLICALPACDLFKSGPELREPGKDVELTAVVLLATGSATADGEALRAGSILKSGQLLKTGANSFCDLQVRGTDSSAMIRLKANSEFVLKGRQFGQKREILAELKKGHGMFDLDKISKSEEFQAISPTAVASVRGTKYELMVKGDSTVIEVAEGQVSSRPRVPALEDLPPEVRERSVVVQESVDQLKSKEVVLGPGKKAEVQAVQVSPEVEEAARKAMEAQAQGPEKAKEAAQALDQSVSEDPSLKQELDKAAPPAAQEIPDPEMQQKLEEYKELIRIEKEKIEGDDVSSAVSDRNRQNQAKLMNRIEKVFNKPSETLVLMNGARVSGVVIQIGATYYVYTVNGQVAYPESQVSGIEF